MRVGLLLEGTAASTINAARGGLGRGDLPDLERPDAFGAAPTGLLARS